MVRSAIDEALRKLEAEQDGLMTRLNKARARASLAVGTEYDEYLSREPELLSQLRVLEDQMRRATSRSEILMRNIENLRSVHALFGSKFTA